MKETTYILDQLGLKCKDEQRRQIESILKDYEDIREDAQKFAKQGVTQISLFSEKIPGPQIHKLTDEEMVIVIWPK